MATMTDIELSSAQRSAVESDAPALVVTASAGSGKTEVVARRVERLLSADAGGSARVLALSYTEKAAVELAQRLEQRLGDALWRVDCSTIHGFAHDLLRKSGTWIGLPPEPEVIVRIEDRVELLDRWLTAEGRAGEAGDLAAALGAIDLARARDLGEAELLSEWRSALADAGALDYSAMIDCASELLTLSSTRRQLWRLYDHIIVDEAQNLTPAQYRLLTSILGPPPIEGLTAMLVGDDKQSIVGFSGADPTLMGRFARQYSAAPIQLTDNYRSARVIVELGQRVAVLLDQACPPSDAVYPALGSVRLEEVADEQVEGAVVGDWIRGLLADGFDRNILVAGEAPSVRPEQIAVLGRSAAALRAVHQVLEGRGVETAMAVRMEDWLTSRPGRVLIELIALRAANHRSPRLELARLLDADEGDLATQDTIATVLADRAPDVAPLAEICTSSTPADLIAVLPGLKIEHDADWEADRLQLQDAWEQFCLRTDRGARTWGSFRIFMARLQRANDLTPGVRLLTVHKAQGREYCAVAVVGLNERQFPDYRAETDEEMQAERRTFYVAVTRPTRELLLTRAGQRMTRSGPWTTQRSRFLDHVET